MAQTIVDLSAPGKRVDANTRARSHPRGSCRGLSASRAGVATVEALQALIGGFTPTSLGTATASAQVSTWRALNLILPTAGKWFLLVVDLPAARGTYLISGDQWRRLAVASAGGTPDPSEAIPLGGGVSAGRSGGDAILINYDQAQSGMGSYDVEVFQL